jgi:predicted peptidase
MMFILSLFVLQIGASEPPRIQMRTLTVADIGVVTYGVSAQEDAGGRARPLILALHPGGERVRGYGTRFMQQVVLPALGDLGAVVVAPDCPPSAKGWAEADRAVLALLEKVRGEYTIDPRRILVVGFSMGGRGTWFMSSQHRDLFTGAIAMAASTGGLPQDTLARVPTYVIHSRDDLVVPFGPAEENARQLEAQGRAIKFEAVSGASHYAMGAYVDSLRRAGRWIAERWAK